MPYLCLTKCINIQIAQKGLSGHPRSLTKVNQLILYLLSICMLWVNSASSSLSSKASTLRLSLWFSFFSCTDLRVILWYFSAVSFSLKQKWDQVSFWYLENCAKMKTAYTLNEGILKVQSNVSDYEMTLLVSFNTYWKLDCKGEALTFNMYVPKGKASEGQNV